eukprot:TRINITY_DN13975_c0_g1_i2.p1 TRINITY_DN13975_c0_g1~~TRINITY_DN13975_c0_g1_i2.p1  ORF type:complete len:512 (+),score=120.78 TRINITY_DN13975_c0_g1_i2:39-1538(+)
MAASALQALGLHEQQAKKVISRLPLTGGLKFSKFKLAPEVQRGDSVGKELLRLFFAEFSYRLLPAADEGVLTKACAALEDKTELMKSLPAAGDICSVEDRRDIPVSGTVCLRALVRVIAVEYGAAAACKLVIPHVRRLCATVQGVGERAAEVSRPPVCQCVDEALLPRLGPCLLDHELRVCDLKLLSDHNLLELCNAVGMAVEERTELSRILGAKFLMENVPLRPDFRTEWTARLKAFRDSAADGDVFETDQAKSWTAEERKTIHDACNRLGGLDHTTCRATNELEIKRNVASAECVEMDISEIKQTISEHIRRNAWEHDPVDPLVVNTPARDSSGRLFLYPKTLVDDIRAHAQTCADASCLRFTVKDEWAGSVLQQVRFTFASRRELADFVGAKPSTDVHPAVAAILDGGGAEFQRLEFLGDRVMTYFVAVALDKAVDDHGVRMFDASAFKSWVQRLCTNDAFAALLPQNVQQEIRKRKTTGKSGGEEDVCGKLEQPR